jgi:cytochrome P450
MSQTMSVGKPSASRQLPRPPGPRGHFFLGVLPEQRQDMLGLYHNTAPQYGDVVRLRFADVDTFALSHPDQFKQFSQDNNRNYRRNTFFNNIVKQFVGLSLFTSDGDDWLSQRRLMQPAFHRRRLLAFGSVMAESIANLIERWDHGPHGQSLEVDQEMMGLTRQVAGRALFSRDLLGESRELGETFTDLSEFMNFRMNHPFAPPVFVPTRPNQQFRQSLRTVDRHIFEMIRQRRQSGQPGDDSLALLIEARDAGTGTGMSDRQLRNEIAVMMFGGHETTSVTLTWAFYLLSQNPGAEAQLHGELDQVLTGRAPTLADLPNLPFNRAVIDETLRLYPPAYGITRQAVEPDEFGGYRLPANASVTVVLYNVHRDPRFWDEPDRFDPSRFSADRSAGRPPFAYLPFGAGPRLCIGNQFALTEAQLALASLAQRYRRQLLPGHPVPPNPIFTLHTSHGLPMNLQRRP